jgi:mycothiol synthase
MHHITVERRMAEKDIAAISRLLHAAAESDGHPPLGEHKWLDLVHGGRSGFSGFVARDEHAKVVGYAHLSGANANWGLEVVVHPAFREEDDPIGTDLVRAALAEVAAEGGGHVHLWVPKPGPLDDALAARNGLARGRELLQMRRPLPVEEQHSTIGVRAFRPGEDEEEWLAVNNRAFGGHPEQGAWDRETLERREQEYWFDPTGFLVYEVDGHIAGSCWTKVHPDEPPIGEIYVISVDPAFQGRGLGRELVLAGLEHLAGIGIGTGMLYVDADNHPARHLYEKLGFEVDHADRAYVGDIPAATP